MMSTRASASSRMRNQTPKTQGIEAATLPPGGWNITRSGRESESLADVLQLLFIHPEIVAHFMDHGHPDLLADFVLRGTDCFNVFLI